jgi:hypothetical protein
VIHAPCATPRRRAAQLIGARPPGIRRTAPCDHYQHTPPRHPLTAHHRRTGQRRTRERHCLNPLTLTEARILAAHDNGTITGHPAALARLQADGLITNRQPDSGAHQITDAGRAAYEQWKANYGPPKPAPASGVLPKLPGRQHDAIITAARRPDHLLPGIGSGAPDCFNQRTLAAVHATDYADIRPCEHGVVHGSYEQSGRSLYLTPTGREYARQRGNIPCSRRRIVIIACGSRKAEPSWERFGYRDVIPAGQLYTGPYHRSLRLAADALTNQTLIRILSARHGLVPLKRPLFPYDTRLGNQDAITQEQIARHTAALDLDDAHVIFLGGRGYARLLRQSVPHALTPLTGGMGDQRAQCHTVSRSAHLAAAWWTIAARLADHWAGELQRNDPMPTRVPPAGLRPPAAGSSRGAGR